MLRRSVSYANVMSTLGVFIALGGTSYAVAKLPKNSVDSAQLKTGAVTTAKLAGGAVTKDKLAPGTSTEGARGPRGAEGPAGPAGATGPGGPAGPVDVVVRKHEQYVAFQLAAGSTIEALRTTLPAGKWWVHAVADVINPGSKSTIRCVLAFDGHPWGADEATELGTGGPAADIFTVVGTADSSQRIAVTLNCSHDAEITSVAGVYPPRVERIRVTAIRATNLDVEDA